MTFDVPILILARGGSKRIKNKNIIDFCGKPLINHAIEKSLKITNNVYVSSDCEKILKISKSCGARVINRPDYLATDEASSVDCLIHFFKIKSYDHVCLLQATSPLIKTEHILSGLQKYKQGKFDAVISATKEKIYVWDEKGKPINFEIKTRNRTQEHQSVFVENGGFYICNKNNIIKRNTIFAGNIGFEEVEKSFSIDIDEESDLVLARILYNRR